MSFNINSDVNNGYPYIINVPIPIAFEYAYPPPLLAWRMSATVNDGYPYITNERYPALWQEPYLDWTYQSNFDIKRDFGRITNNLTILKGDMFPQYAIKTEWEYTDNVYKTQVQRFINILNGLIDYVGLAYPHITIPTNFDYTVLLEIETVTYLLRQAFNGIYDLSLYADDTLHLIDWTVDI